MNPRASALLKALQVEPVEQSQFDGFELYSVDLGNILRKFNKPVNVIVVGDEWCQRGGAAEELTRALLNVQISRLQMVVLLLPERHGFSAHDFSDRWVKFCDAEIDAVVNSRKPRSTFTSIIRKQIQLPILSPYNTNYIVTRRMFFGREAELKEVIRGRLEENFIIAGPRRIGKSSFAEELMRRLREDQRSAPATSKLKSKLPAPGSKGEPVIDFRVAHADCNLLAGLDPEEELFRTVVKSLGISERDSVYNWQALFGKSVRPGSWFEFLQRLITTRYGSVLIIIDEIDGLIKSDRSRSWSTMRKLQGLSDTGRATFVLIGFKELFHALSDNSFPLYQRCRTLVLENLSKDATEKLIIEPMKELGITIVEEWEVAGRIFYETGGMPSIIQSICREAIRILAENKTAEITPDLIDSIINSHALQLLDDYLRWIDYDASPIEKAIVYFAATEDRLSVRGFIDFLHKRQIHHYSYDDLRRPLDDLMLANILREVARHQTYQFTVEALRKTLEVRPERSEVLNRALMEIRR